MTIQYYSINKSQDRKLSDLFDINWIKIIIYSAISEWLNCWMYVPEFWYIVRIRSDCTPTIYKWRDDAIPCVYSGFILRRNGLFISDSRKSHLIARFHHNTQRVSQKSLRNWKMVIIPFSYKNTDSHYLLGSCQLK